jgi:hypothetical protein
MLHRSGPGGALPRAAGGASPPCGLTPKSHTHVTSRWFRRVAGRTTNITGTGMVTDTGMVTGDRDGD